MLQTDNIAVRKDPLCSLIHRTLRTFQEYKILKEPFYSHISFDLQWHKITAHNLRLDTHSWLTVVLFKMRACIFWICKYLMWLFSSTSDWSCLLCKQGKDTCVYLWGIKFILVPYIHQTTDWLRELFSLQSHCFTTQLYHSRTTKN